MPTRIQNEDALRRLFERDSVVLINKSPFIGGVLMAHRFSAAAHVPVADFDNKTIYLNGSVDTESERIVHPYTNLDKETRISILYYLSLHVILEHFNIPDYFNQTLARLAQDISAFNMLPQFRQAHLSKLQPGFKLMEGKVIIPVPSFEATEEELAEGIEDGVPEWDGVSDFELALPATVTSWEAIYHSMRASALDMPPGFLAALAKAYPQLALSHIKPCFCESEDIVRMRVRVTSLLKNAQGMYGELSGGLLDYIDSLHKSKVSWVTYVKEFISEALVKMNYTWYPPNFRRLHIGYMPSRRGVGVKDILFFLDTSGSMDITELEQGISEVVALRDTTPCRIHFACCDAAVYEWVVIEPNDPFDPKKLAILGRGGTDFQPIFALVDEEVRDGKRRKPAGVIVVTDGDGAFPSKAPNYPVIWVSTTKKDPRHYPFGKVVSI